MQRDEWDTSVDNAADRLSYLVISYGLLLIVAYRSLVDGTGSIELLALIVMAGFVGLLYRLRERTLTRRTWAVYGLTVFLAMLVAGGVLLATRS